LDRDSICAVPDEEEEEDDDDDVGIRIRESGDPI
jgi:hypothetical protein